jgi:STE24 endopeptidase
VRLESAAPVLQMSLRKTWGLIALFALAVIGWGVWIGRSPALPRPSDLTSHVEPSWYQHLPSDPSAATAAYLARVPHSMRSRGEAYSDSRLWAFGLRVLSLLLATALLCTTRFAAQSRDTFEARFSRPIVTDAGVALSYLLALYVLTLPAEIYATFLRPRSFGFSDESFLGWLTDSLIDWGVFTLFYLVAILAIYRLMRRQPTRWVLGATLVYVVLRGLYSLLSPGLIEPLTNEFRPLADGAQKQQILALARANGLSDVAIVTSNASRQTRLLNAHVSGLGGTARISVDDNTLQHTSDAMLRAVVAHEIGHYVLGHEAEWVFLDSVIAAIGFLLISVGLHLLIRHFGPKWRIGSIGDIASVPVFWGLYLLWGFVSLPLTNAFSRALEHQADLYSLNSARSPHGLAEFMIHDADTTRMQPTRLEYALLYTHPSDAERVRTAMEWRAAMNDLTPAP